MTSPFRIPLRSFTELAAVLGRFQELAEEIRGEHPRGGE